MRAHGVTLAGHGRLPLTRGPCDPATHRVRSRRRRRPTNEQGHFIGKALGEGMNGYRPIIELMNANFGIYGMAELSSAGNTYATTGGQFEMPMTLIGAGGTAPAQSLGAEHSQPFHA